MPRVKALEAQYAAKDFTAFLRGAMSAERVSRGELCQTLDVSYRTLSKRLEHPEQFTVADLRAMCKKLGLPDETVCRFVLGKSGGS